VDRLGFGFGLGLSVSLNVRLYLFWDWTSDWVMRKVGLKVINSGWALARFSQDQGRVSLKDRVGSG
jgi:hypothetical protein